MLLVLLIVSALVNYNEAGCSSTQSSQIIGHCNDLTYTVTACSAKTQDPLTYTCSAKLKGNVSPNVTGTVRVEPLCAAAAFPFFKSDIPNPQCACTASKISIGNCNFDTNYCMYFADADAFQSKTATYSCSVTSALGKGDATAATSTRACQLAMQKLVAAKRIACLCDKQDMVCNKKISTFTYCAYYPTPASLTSFTPLFTCTNEVGTDDSGQTNKLISCQKACVAGGGIMSLDSDHIESELSNVEILSDGVVLSNDNEERIMEIVNDREDKNIIDML